MLFGSLAGAVFTWWVNREVPLVVGYITTTTSTGADAKTISVVPRLRLRIDDNDIPAIHTHVVKVSRVSGGYIDKLDLALTFQPRDLVQKNLTLFGLASNPPSVLHSISCQAVATGAKCSLGPLDGQGEFEIVMATDVSAAPTVTAVGRNVRLASLGDLAKESGRRVRDNDFIWFPLVFIGAITCLELAERFFKAWMRKRQQ